MSTGNKFQNAIYLLNIKTYYLNAMKVLILGSKGNLGTQLVKIFQEKKHQTTGWDKDDLDILDQEKAGQAIKELTPDIIINAIAYNAVDKCEEDEDQFTLAKKLNIEVPTFLAKICLDLKAVLIHYSSDYVFAGNDPKGYDEKAKTAPLNRYGFTKAEGEKEIARMALQGLKWYLIRTSKLFGPQGSSPAAKPSFFDLMLDLAKKNDRLKAVNEEKSCFTYTPDLAKATGELIETDRSYGIYHITNTEPATWYEACQALFEIAGIEKDLSPVSSSTFPRPAERPKHSQLLNTKLPPLRSFKQALKDHIEKEA
ncbi:sugar nucleotide-binding protein [Candidatus Falkowbacteria bacterium]|nr:sugar nucleotide-binding protein [Candidatus Falkowbacteria bacterium]